MRIRSAWLLTLFGASALPSQTTAPTPAPHVLVETVGPDGWRLRFGPTNLGSLLESEAGRRLWEPRVLPLLRAWQELLGDEAAFAESRGRILGYGGRIRLALWVDDKSVGNQELAHAALLLDVDGRTDLTALAKDLRSLQARLPGEWAERDLGGAKIDVCSNDDEAMTAPVREGEHLLLAYARGDGLAEALGRARSRAADAQGKPPAPAAPALQVRIDLAAFVAMHRPSDEDDKAAMHQLGLDSLGAMTVTLGTAGPHVQLELAHQFTSDARGLFGAVFPASQGLPALAHLAVPGANSWKAGHFDFAALWSAVEGARSAGGDGTREELRAESVKELGIDVAADLLAHATDEALLLGSPLQDLDEVAEATWSLAVRLRDETAFAKGLTALLAKAKPFLMREDAEQHGEIELRRYGNMLGYDVWFAVGNGLFVMSAGRDAGAQLRALLDAKKAAVTPAPTAAPADFGQLQRFLPPGLNGLGRGDLDSIVAMPQEWWLMLLDELTPLEKPEPAEPEERDRFRALLKEHRLDTIRSATGYADRHWRLRLFW
jgi:hypothetical protein